MAETIPLVPSNVYHLYNHANGSENLFREHENYRYFLKKYTEYVFPLAETFAYCLLPNHVHFMIRMRDEGCLTRYFLEKRKDPPGLEDLAGLLSREFGHFFNAYAKAYNERYDRRGSLFEKPFKRKPVENEGYFTSLIAYIHNNPLHHGFVKGIDQWPHSSWFSYLSDKPTKIAREEGLAWFGGREEFVKFHHEASNLDPPGFGNLEGLGAL